MHQLHIIIVGGGVGGLCLAQGLKMAGVSFAVYERDRNPDARLQGYRLNIEPVGSQALAHCLSPELWELLVATAGDPGTGMGVFDENLHGLMHENGNADATDPARGAHAVSRVTLRRLLLSGLEQHVHFDKRFTHYEQLGDGLVTAYFADGTSATGSLLVGADGFGSRVRGQFLPDASRIDVPGIGIGGKLALDGNTQWLPAALTAGKNMFLPPRDFLFTAVFRRREQARELAHRIDGRQGAAGASSRGLLDATESTDYLMWAYVAHRKTLPADVTRLHGAALRRLLEERTRAWHPSLRRMINETDAGSVECFDFKAAAPVKPWASTTVTLLGDAIHYMPPVAGLGGNAALRDADLLRRALTAVHRGESELLPVLQAYEAEMLATGFASVREARLYSELAISRSRVLRTLARIFFRTCGAIPALQRAIFES